MSSDIKTTPTHSKPDSPISERSESSEPVPGPPPFKWSHLWEPAIVNPVNRKSYTLPVFNLNDPYARAFHLSWLGFFVAFLSWFAFPPLIPEAIKSDLKLSKKQVANSSVVALVATLGIRIFVGPVVDRYGPRKVMAALLVLGAIPSGLAGTAHNAETLYVIRFFIGILGATFVPCQAWTSAWFDKNCVGTANALVGGWGNMGGGATFAIMTSLYDSLLRRGLTQHVAWRAAFAIVPAPILLFVAALTMLAGQDHPVGKWSERHNIPATALAVREGHDVHLDSDEKPAENLDKKDGGEKGIVSVHPAGDIDIDKVVVKSKVDIAINEALTFKTAVKILSSPLTWLPCLGYITTFGLELVIDAQMADILFVRFNKVLPGFDQTKAGYYTSIFGFLNLVTRPYGGYLGDVVYRRWGTRAKKHWTILCGLVMGVFCLWGGVYLEKANPHMPVLMAIFSISVIFSEFGNGANFALVPHCNPYNNGLMSGLVGSFGNLGGVIFAMVFRFQHDAGRSYWIIGIICIVLNLIMIPIPVPKY